MKNLATIILVAALAACFVTTAGAQDTKSIASHPSKLTYKPFDFKVPPAAQFREVLPNGMVVFIAEDRMLPTFDMSVFIRTGGAWDPDEKAGLASLTGEQIRDGGTQSLTPEELDEKVEFLAAGLSSGISDTGGRAGLSLLAKDADEGIALLIDMLRHPRFDEERLTKAKERILQNIKRRNDSTQSIQGLEWAFLMNGENHFSTRYPSSASVNAITRDDMVAFHKKYYHPGNMIVVLAGDFDRGAMLKKIEKAFADWPIGELAPKTFPAPDFEPTPGVYVVQKDDVNQGRISIGHRTVLRGTPDEFPLRIMNAVLGGSGFRSRLMANVRTKEGLTYDTGSSFGQGVYYPDDFQCWVQSKSNSCAYATKLIVEEIKRLQTEKVPQDELESVKSYIVEFMPQQFESKMAVLSRYASDEMTGRDLGYWPSFIDNLKKVTADDVMRVAKKHLHPDQLVILAVGDSDAIIGGGHDKAPDLKMDAFGKVTKLPLRDPDTLKR